MKLFPRKSLYTFFFLILSNALCVAYAKAENSIQNIYDAFGKEHDQAIFDWGFSAFIQYNDQTILFDGGTSADNLKKNAEVFGVDLRDVDFVVLSHSDPDHVNGLDYLLEVNPDAKIYMPEDMFALGSPAQFRIAGTEPEKREQLPEELQYFHGKTDVADVVPSGRFWKANVEFIGSNSEISEGIHLVKTSSPFVVHFSKYPNLTLDGRPSEPKEAHFLEMPELSLVLDTDKGKVLIVGCSHSTVEAIIRETKEYTQTDVELVMGGYHLLHYTSGQVQGMANRIKHDLGVNRVAPAHCSGHLGFKVFRETFGSDFIPAGLGSNIKF